MFMDKNFLLNTESAKRLYFDFAEKMPICDYHCHLSPKEIFENKAPENISQLWLAGDHYKWRAMRSCGIEEKYCTGNASDREKFLAFAKTLQYCIGNPLYHWAHLELQRYFGIDTPLNAKTAEEIYERANKAIAEGDFRPQSLIANSNVKFVCTTDDPIDDLKYHKLLNERKLPFRVLPSFRPDKALNINADGFIEYINELGKAADIEIGSVADVINALYKRAEYFNECGCKISDQAFEYVPYARADNEELNDIFARAMLGEKVSRLDEDRYKTAIMLTLGAKYRKLGWTMEIHIGAMRNNNSVMFEKLGADTGFDSVGDCGIAKPLSRFLNALEMLCALPKTILFNLNDKDNTVLATMLGNFQSAEAESKIQFGPAWWFLDTMDGMTAQLKSLGNLGVLGKFVGMETDSRSFTSYARHEYFRRILCRLLGQWLEEGMYAYDEDIVKEIVEGICYNNAVKYFDF
ncbi:MAG: glucuronate isomerase [Eubacterium sp.]|nr:glucuronate isomerase [Eubacterium sp.]